MRLSSETLHASTVALDGRAVLISGLWLGKSDLALRLLDRGFTLVSDDQTIVRKDDGRVLAARRPSTASWRSAASASSRWIPSGTCPSHCSSS